MPELRNAFEVLAEGQQKAQEEAKRKWSIYPCRLSLNERQCIFKGAKTNNQPALVGVLRPPNWTQTPMDLPVDVLVQIVQAIMHRADEHGEEENEAGRWCESCERVADIRAFALVSRSTAAAVATALDTACRRLRQASQLVARRKAQYRDLCLDYSNPDDAQEDEKLDEADALIDQAEDAFVQCMISAGIRDRERQDGLITNSYRVFFQDARSLLGHMHNGCELCGEDGQVPAPPHAGPVALYACARCSRGKAVVFTLDKYRYGKDKYVVVNGRAHAYAEFPRREDAAYNYACALLSKHRLHQRRMKARRASEVGSTRLIRRVHRVEITPALDWAWQMLGHIDGQGRPLSFVKFELWHTLPAGIPQNLTYAAVMGLQPSHETRREAARESVRRKQERSAVTRRRRAYNALVKEHDSVIQAVKRVTMLGQTWMGWIQIIDLCLAARAFETRWLFGQGRPFHTHTNMQARYKILTLFEPQRRILLSRVETVANVLYDLLMTCAPGAHSNPRHDGSMRTCILEIIKQLPLEELDTDTTVLRKVIRVLLGVHMTLQVHNCPRSEFQRLTATMTVDGSPARCQFFRERHIVLDARVTQYDINKLAQAISWKNKHPERLTNELVLAAQHKVNGGGCASIGLSVRAIVFGLPGAWPEWVGSRGLTEKTH